MQKRTKPEVLDLDHLPAGALISARQLQALAQRSRTSLWRDVREGRLARPVKLGAHAIRWRVADARRYLAGRH